MAIEVGSVVEGVVSRITNFGAFIDLDDGKNGLVHISEISDVYVRDVHDFLSEGDKVQAKVINIDERGKVALSLKQAKPKEKESEIENQSVTSKGKFARNERIDRGVIKKPVNQTTSSFEDKLSKFMKESDEKLADRKRRTDSKRGGRGSRRSD